MLDENYQYRLYCETSKVYRFWYSNDNSSITILSLAQIATLGKDLRKNKRNDQLVKYKNTELYLLLYILIDHEE